MAGLFVTGTDTDVGKTFVSCALALVFSMAGLMPAVAEPPDECLAVLGGPATFLGYVGVTRTRAVPSPFSSIDTSATPNCSTVQALVSDMRIRLAQQWRMPNGQQQAGTNRTDKQLAAEVQRGCCRSHVERLGGGGGSDVRGAAG